MSDAVTRRLAEEAAQLHLAGRIPEAEKAYRKLLQRESRNADALHMLGTLRLQQGDAAGAIALIEKAIRLKPGQAPMLINLAVARRENEEPAKAAQTCREALTRDPRSAEAFWNLGHALRDLGDNADAIEAYQNYLRLQPNDGEGYAILGDTFKLSALFDEAMDAYDTALVFAPQLVQTHLSMAGMLTDRGWFHAACVILEKAADIAPDNAEVQGALAVAQLRLGRLREGWANFDARFRDPRETIIPRPEPPPYWKGESLQGKKILLWTEQGIGDEILHAGLIPDVLATGAECTIACSPRMEPVFSRSFPRANITAAEDCGTATERVHGFDYQLATGSLGKFFRPDFSSFPRHQGYLKADPARVAAYRARYQERARGRRLVGLSWLSKNATLGQAKSIPLISFAPLLETAGIMFVNLQYGDCLQELSTVREQLATDILHDEGVDATRDMDGFLAQVAAMDLVVTTSNTTAHAAGAQNTPVWILLPSSKSLIWYWFVTREGSPWYPAARLFRPNLQISGMSKGWESDVVARAAAELARWSGERAP